MNIEREILNITKEYVGKLPEGEIESVIDLAQHKEHELALDNLCTQIEEHKLSISTDSFLKIDEIIKEANMDEIDLDSLKPLLK